MHKNVIQKIETLDCSKDFMFANFSAHVENIRAGAVNRDSKYYQMTKDGFVFLVMGFTGKKSARFKEACIAEFNRMEEQLKCRCAPSGRRGRYQITLICRDLLTGEEDTFRNSCNTTEEIICGTAKNFGYWIDGLTEIPVCPTLSW